MHEHRRPTLLQDLQLPGQGLDKRNAAGKPRLRWRASRGPRCALGWIPFTNQDITVAGSIVYLRGRKFRLWKHRENEGKIKSGNFSQDARGRWYCNIVCEVERGSTNRTAVVGFDTGHKTTADGSELDQARFYRDMEQKLAEAERRGKTRLVKTINAKVKNCRKDIYHKFTRSAVDRSGAVFVGNISSAWQVAAGNGKATLDASWSILRGFFRYTCDHAGLAFAEVNEAYTTQTCSCCKALTGPRGEQDLNIRRWVCCDCGAEHDRDRNAAINIARLGCEALGLEWPGSPSAHAGEASPSGLVRRSHEEVVAVALHCGSCGRSFEAAWVVPASAQCASERPTGSDEEVGDRVALQDCAEQIARKAALEVDIGLHRGRAPWLVPHAGASARPSPSESFIRATASLPVVASTGACRLLSVTIIGLARQYSAPEDSYGSVNEGQRS